MKCLIGIVSALIMQSSIAGEIYTCKVNGGTVYQGKPCAGSRALSEKVNQAKEKQQAVELARHRDAIESRERSSRPEPKIGMTKTEAEKSTWGEPDKINTTTTASGEFEQWIYRTYYTGSKYLHFTNGKLSSISK